MERGRVSLLDRVQETCTHKGILLIQYICNEDYAKTILTEQETFTHQDGLVDTVRFLLEDILLNCLVSQSF